ncbi:hypothetical protein QWJ34_13915 [Saccharibacillus sp. CPCC 101409]|uniref:hypothetical protein n=1 Tax=Saccharibacillus sp. CPCC 101409 TaxID=3058041 RepID=UPI0026713986|nr:hypothetical protein [Saccharibacillus sp. CPCC 101409]MDO3410864.1 hypothetical protein [Saccharibacillus sp. CPCC 101409]
MTDNNSKPGGKNKKPFSFRFWNEYDPDTDRSLKIVLAYIGYSFYKLRLRLSPGNKEAAAKAGRLRNVIDQAKKIRFRDGIVRS